MTRWTLPAAWLPRPHDDDEPRPADTPTPDAQLFGRPVRFDGHLIVAHLSDLTTRTHDPRKTRP